MNPPYHFVENIIKPLLRTHRLAVAGILAAVTSSLAAPVGFTVSPPETVMTSAQMKERGIREFDTGIYMIAEREQCKWFSTCSKTPEGQTISVGPRDEPFSYLAECGVQIEGLPNRRIDRDYAGNFGWFANVYDIGNGHVLGFVHCEESMKDRTANSVEERAKDHPNPARGAGVYFRFGLALSRDGGRHWQWLGYILEPELSLRDWYMGAKANINIGYANYILKDGWFQVYYRDSHWVDGVVKDGVAVMRAKVDDVVRAAEAGKVTMWHKYHDGEWSEPGLGGKFTPLNIPTRGLMHGDAAYNSYLKKYILVTRGHKWEAVNKSEVQMTTSDDGLTWSDWQVLYQDKHLNDYPTIITTGDNSEVTGKEFYVYYLKHHDRIMPEKFGQVRFDRVKVTLD